MFPICPSPSLSAAIRSAVVSASGGVRRNGRESMSRHRSTSQRAAVAVVLAVVSASIVLPATPAAAADSTGPVLTRVSIVGGDSYTANVTNSPIQIGVLISATDDQSGVSDAD